jgi:methionyl-tRNA formyltransferase
MLKTILKGIDIKQALVISIGAPWILDEETLQTVFRENILNLHGTHLPKERGGTLFSWQILSGKHAGICLLHQMTGKIDQGPVVAYEEFIYPSSCRKPIDFINFYNQKNIAFLQEFIKSYIPGSKPECSTQPEYLSSYWPRLLAPVNGWIDWSWKAIELERFICAFDAPYGGARCRWNNQVVILREAYSQASDGYSHPFQQGLVYRNNGKWLNVAVREGELLICNVSDEEGKDLLPEINVGDRFYILPEDKVNSMQRVVKTKEGLVTKKIKR